MHLIWLVLLATALGQQILYRCSTRSPDVGNMLRKLQRTGSIDIWTESNTSAVFRAKKRFTPIEGCISVVQPRPTDRRILGPGWHQRYHPYDEILQFLRQKVQQYPQNFRVSSYGKSVEGRDLIQVDVSMRNFSAPHLFMITTGLHAREWISLASFQFLLDDIAMEVNGTRPGNWTQLLQHFDIVGAFVNPDGYIYTWNSDRLWRKNRRRNDDGSFGVDLNRNFDVQWGGESDDPSAETYQGPSAASEPETQAVQELINSRKPYSLLDLHSYGQLFLRASGFTTEPTKEEPLLKRIATRVVKAVQSVTGAAYRSIRASEFYPTTGSLDDFASSVAKLSGGGWTMELRGPQSDLSGFQAPPNQIVGAGRDAVTAVNSMLLQAIQQLAGG